ncbi:hypothetical protein MTR_3g064730 [Medicago truncatula]|uniref:Uncharacterized protein n=1 Tax=Medicago truncatula TaxID=3880 RepID=G7J8M6_MEDTR|nr:hypothetical protein MTR_3g064730 [Medicago truncatula]
MAVCLYMWMWRNKTIFEDDFQRPINPTFNILKMVEDINCNTPFSQHKNFI